MEMELFTHSLTCWLQVMGLHLPDAPPPDSDEEEDREGAAAQRSRASIPMDAGETHPTRIIINLFIHVIFKKMYHQPKRVTVEI